MSVYAEWAAARMVLRRGLGRPRITVRLTGTWVGNGVHSVEHATKPAEAMPMNAVTSEVQMQALLGGYRATQMLFVVAKLGLADLLASGPRTASDLATATGSRLSLCSGCSGRWRALAYSPSGQMAGSSSRHWRTLCEAT